MIVSKRRIGGHLTFDMSGGRRQAKPAGGRPLDGGLGAAGLACTSSDLRDVIGPSDAKGNEMDAVGVAALLNGSREDEGKRST